jgi:hypothetical protein
LCCSSVHQYRGSLRLLARHRRRLHLLAYTPAYPTPSGGPYETSRGNAWTFRAVPPAHTLMRPGTPSTSFAAVVPARSRLDFGRPVRLARLRPGALPQTLQTPPHGGRPVLRSSHWPRDANKRSSRRSVLPRPARHYPRLWLRTPLGVGPTGLSPASSMRRPAHTTRRSAPVPRLGTLPLVVAATWGPPSRHRHDGGPIGATGSHVPHERLDPARATFMPESAWPVGRCLPGSSQGNDSTPVSLSSIRFRHVIGWFAFARLPGPHLTHVCAPSPQRSAPRLIHRRTLRWFVISSCKATTEGPPPSPAQHCSAGSIFYISTFLAFVSHSRRRT